MIKLIHGADLHLDSPFSGLTPEQAAARRQEQRELLDRLARLAREREADLLLLSGDLLDSRRTYRETAQALARSLGSLPCPVFLAPGNHDFYGPQSLYAALDWPENVHIFTSGSVRRAELPGLDCVVYGRAFLGPREDRSPLEGFRAERDGRVQLMAVHGEVDGRGEYGPISREDIACSGLDYLALGHIHQTSGLQREGDTFWAYPGCPEGRGFDELGDKGVLYVEAEPGSCRAEFVPLCRRRYQILSVDVTGAEDLAAAVRAALPPDTAGDIYRILLTGERGAEALDLEGLTRALAPRFYGLTLRDRTRVQGAVWDRMEEDTLTGLFLRLMAARCRAEPENEILQQAVRFGLAALENGEDVAP